VPVVGGHAAHLMTSTGVGLAVPMALSATKNSGLAAMYNLRKGYIEEDDFSFNRNANCTEAYSVA